MQRYFGLLLAIILIAFLYLVFNQLNGQVRLGNIFSFFTMPGFRGATSTPAKSSAAPAQPLSNQSYSSPPSTSQPNITPPAGFTVSQLSPYYQKIRISSVSPSYYYGSASQINLNSDYSLQSGLDVTGWRITTNRGDILVPQAIADYTPSGLAAASDVVLGSGQYLGIYGSLSPIGRNFRLNECTGFLNNNYTFIPSLPNSCPYPDRSLISSFSGACQSFIFSLGSCAVPSANDVNRFGGPYDANCQSYLMDINYTGCYNRYRSDTNFFSNEWRAWLGSSIPLDSQHDQVRLFDRNGLLVDVYTY